MDSTGFGLSLLGFLPWYARLMPLFLIVALWVFNYLRLWTRLKLIERPLNKRQLSVLSFLILFASFLIAFPILFHGSQREGVLKQRISELERTLSSATKRDVAEEPIVDISEKPGCENWDHCTDFRSDLGLDNKYYRHTSNDPQKLILEGGPFANPPLYFESELSPFYKFQLDVQPLNEDAANVFVESREMFQLFIGDNDYRSFAFLTWDQKESRFIRGSDAKIYLERDLNASDMEPKTQLSVIVETKKGGNKVEVEFTIIFKPVGGDKEKAKFSRTIELPAAEPEKFLTKVGTGMFMARGNIPQAKFYFMGVRQK